MISLRGVSNLFGGLYAETLRERQSKTENGNVIIGKKKRRIRGQKL